MPVRLACFLSRCKSQRHPIPLVNIPVNRIKSLVCEQPHGPSISLEVPSWFVGRSSRKLTISTPTVEDGHHFHLPSTLSRNIATSRNYKKRRAILIV